MNYFSKMKIFRTLMGQEIFFSLKKKKTLEPNHQLKKKVKALTGPTF